LGTLVHAFQLGVATEGKSPNAIAVVTNSVRYFHDFIVTTGYSSEATRASQNEIHAFIRYLQQKTTKSRKRGLTGVKVYLEIVDTEQSENVATGSRANLVIKFPGKLLFFRGIL
jgi:uncharacterized protein (DUF2344 family)